MFNTTAARSSLTLLCLLFELAVIPSATLPLQAQSIDIVHIVDVNSEGRPGGVVATSESADLDGKFYFAGQEDDGRELYVSDGTELGTFQLVDIASGADTSNPKGFTRVGDENDVASRIFFAATTVEEGRELWITDGTVEGTQQALYVGLGPESSDPTALTEFNGELYYSAYVAGDRTLFTINPTTLQFSAPGFLLFSLPIDAELDVTAGKLFFAATSSGDPEIWSTDGGTPVAETSLSCEGIGDIHAVGGLVFFVCTYSDRTEVLRFNNATGTVTMVHQTADAATVDQLVSADDYLYFVVDSQTIWSYHNTNGSLTQVTTFDPGADIDEVTKYSDRIFFVADGSQGREIFFAQGTTVGLIKDIHPTGDADPSELTLYDQRVYFAAYIDDTNQTLWSTNGTLAGTSQVADPGVGLNQIHELARTSSGVFFSVDNTSLWHTDGTTVGTELVREFQLFSSNPIGLFADAAAANGPRLFFVAQAGLGYEPAVTNDTNAGHAFLGDIAPGPDSNFSLRFLTGMSLPAPGSEPIVLFQTNGSLWRTDGTPGGTSLVREINSAGSAAIAAGALLDDSYVFAADDGIVDDELWRTDGTGAGTELLLDLNPAGVGLVPELFEYNGEILFSGQAQSTDLELWTTDGTVGGTEQLFNTDPSSLDPFAFTRVDGLAFFYGFDGAGNNLFKTDGTSAGTVALTAVEQESAEPIECDSALYFANAFGVNGQELWRANASVAGPVLDLNPGSANADPEVIGCVNGLVLFWAEDGSEDGLRRLWASTGAVDNASLIGTFDIAYSHVPSVVFENDLYFVAGLTATTGIELWRTDGTAVGTEVIDLETGSRSSFPSGLTVAGDRLYFSAYDLVAKQELHFLTIEVPLFADGFESGDTGAWN